MISYVGIIGAGSMGTAIAQSISLGVKEVTLFARNQDIIDSINYKRKNFTYFPNIKLNSNVNAKSINSNLDLTKYDAIIIAVPSGGVRELVHSFKYELANKIIITVSKGLEYPSLKTMSEIISDELSNSWIVCLSGPNFADEIAYGHIAGITIGTDEPKFYREISEVFKNFIFDFSDDIKAVEICGVLKNVYAIGAGLWDSVYSSNNEHHTFLNLCYKEMYNFLKKISIDPEIVTKFCCFGDFNLTAGVDKSRNRTLGLMIGKKIIQLPFVQKGIVFEGQKSVQGIIHLAEKNGVDVPIAKYVYDALNNKCNITQDIITCIPNYSI